MNNITIRQRIVLGFAIIVAAMLVMGGIAFVRLQHIQDEETLLRSDSIPGLYASGQMEAAWHSYYTALHGLVGLPATELPQAQARLEERRAAYEATAKRYDDTISQAEDRAGFQALAGLTAPLFAQQAELIRLAGSDSGALQKTLRERIDPMFEKAERAIGRMIEYNNDRAVVSGKRIDDAVQAARYGMSIAFAVALLVAVLAGFYLLKAITEPLQRLADAADVFARGDFSQRLNFRRTDEFGILANGYNKMSGELSGLVGQVQTSGIQVNSSINEITATLREQQATAAQIAATTTEIGATSREIAATSKELARTMDSVATSAEQTATLAGNGQDGLAQMEETMRRMIDATAAISGKLAVLAEKANNIGQVVTTITKVADQTNLLSLNAAIEAEKAGEYGRGFSVVAVEIRRLADQTAMATLDIEQMVREIQSAVSAGVMGMDKFSEEVRRGTGDVQRVGEQLTQVIDHVQTMVPRFDAANEGVQAQAAGAEQINLALSQLSEAAQQTVDALRQSNQAIDELHQVSASLRDGISKFKLLA
ncbi:MULTISPECIES: methyl-accepting chemotaxis protein [Lysobacter]|uniref:Methyl-accepting chemotaxis protein n=1 Tax=Lysobacter firmicutimachus TaxID=1792846 RepID=A0ABU8D5T2_9GAMM|nr:methyl-accepting chemotaxis protein [Lysobacter antibioticus]